MYPYQMVCRDRTVRSQLALNVQQLLVCLQMRQRLVLLLQVDSNLKLCLPKLLKIRYR